MKSTLNAIIAVALLIGFSIHGQEDDMMEGSHEGSHSHKKASYKGFTGIEQVVAHVNPTAGNSAKGVVTFMRHGNRVKVIADIEGLKPNAKHGFHVHEFGDCRGDGAGAGGHYNPAGASHAGLDVEERHAGDLGNLESDENGKARYEQVVKNITLAGKKNPVLGRSVVIHADPDDLTSQPTGNSGARIGCGVIGVAKSE